MPLKPNPPRWAVAPIEAPAGADMPGSVWPPDSRLDDAARRRFNLLPFDFKPTVADQMLEAKLQAEWPSILRWLIVGCLDWQATRLLLGSPAPAAAERGFSRWAEAAAMTAAFILMACAAFRAQTAHQHRDDGPLVARPYINSAIRLGLAGVACFVAAKVLA